MPAPIEDRPECGSPVDIRSALKLGIARLRAEGVSSDTLAAELLLLHATHRSRTSLYSHPEDPLSDLERETYFALIEKRSAGVPTQHLTGKQEFWGLSVEVTPDVLIPRPETEHLIEVALDRMALADLRARGAQNMSGQGLLVADIGTGSGCIALALAKELPEATIYAVDISPAALAVARRNASRLGLSSRIHCLSSNLFSAFSAASSEAPPALGSSGWHFDLVVSNPPYIGRREAASLPREVREHEPELALYGGQEGYELYAALIRESAVHLKPGGMLVLELGHDSLAAVRPLFDSPDWTSVGITADLAGIARVLAAERT